jgi:hypothetical protein
MPLLENQMEDLIAEEPDSFLQERGLKLIARQYKIGNYIFDLLFEDRHKGKLVVELQRGVLNRNHCYKIFDYIDEYRSRNPLEFVDVIVVANEITSERKKMLTAKGIKYIEIPEAVFIERFQNKPKNLGSGIQENTLKNKVENIKRLKSKRVVINYYLPLADLKTKINNYVKRGKVTKDKISRKILLLDILGEYHKSNDRYISAKYIFELIKKNKNGKYQKDYCNSFFRIIYYPLLVSDDKFDGKNLAEKAFNDVRPPKYQYPNFKVLESYNLDEIKLRVNINDSHDYKRDLEDIIKFATNIYPEIF